MQWVVLIVVVVASAAAYVTWLAARLDRLAARCEAGATALEAALARQELSDQRTEPGAEQAHRQAQNRVDLARQFHSDALRDDQALRNRISVRLLGLSKRHPVAAFAYIDEPTPTLPSKQTSNWSS